MLIFIVLIVISVFESAYYSKLFALLLLHNKVTDDGVVVTHDAVFPADFNKGDIYHIRHLVARVSADIATATLG